MLNHQSGLVWIHDEAGRSRKPSLAKKMKTKIRKNLCNNFKPALVKAGSQGVCAALMVGAMDFYCTNASAVGFRVPSQDPEAIARGNAFVATADNPSAIYYNPAGITQIEGQSLSAGLYAISTDVKFEPATGGPSARTKGDYHELPQFYYVISPKDFPLSFGLGIYVPYGLTIDWGQNPPFNNVAKNGSLEYVTVNPVVAWKALPSLSVGIGPTINYSKADFNRGVGFAANDEFHFVGDDYTFGFDAGIRWQPCEMLSFGAKYNYLTTMNYKGHSSITPPLPFPPPFQSTATDTSASIRFPQSAAVGVSFRPTENWNLEFDIDWTDWDNFNQIAFNNTPVGNQVFLLNYKSSFMYEFGVTRQLGKGYWASLGYMYSENSSPEANFNPLIPDSNWNLGSAGFGHKGKHWEWALAYQFAINAGRQVNGSSYNQPAPGFTVDGTYRTFLDAFNGSVTFKF
ncbi:MAG: Membrane protein involved in aromatic hydrocarbon degradation [Pedosphaera sp.]|nr:Membrane protein involved in aromatic hydrocarbon degradation [Pedosphaera sp.]